MTDSEGEFINSRHLVAYLRQHGGATPVSNLEAAGFTRTQISEAVAGNDAVRMEGEMIILSQAATFDANLSFYGEVQKGPKKHRRPQVKSAATKGVVDAKSGHGQVGYLCIADEFDLEGLLRHYRSEGYHATLNFDVLHVSDRPPDEQLVKPSAIHSTNYGATHETTKRETKIGFDIFVFQYGAIVYWGVSLKDYKRIVETDFTMPKSKITRYMVERYTTQLIAENFPVWCTFEVDATPVQPGNSHGEPDERFREMINYDHFVIRNNAADIKLCISHALAQSAKIDFLEIKVKDLTQQCKPLPRELKESGSVTISERRLLQLRGEVLFYRLMLKAGSDLIDEPELFWQNPWLKPLYQTTKDFFEISERVVTLDNKLQTNNDILAMIADQFNQRHGSRLEWIVIWLVMVEVVIGVLELILDVKPWVHMSSATAPHALVNHAVASITGHHAGGGH